MYHKDYIIITMKLNKKNKNLLNKNNKNIHFIQSSLQNQLRLRLKKNLKIQ